VGKYEKNKRNNETYNESGKKSDGQRYHMDFAETSSPEARMDEQVFRK
jgi:hypothetical protein